MSDEDSAAMKRAMDVGRVIEGEAREVPPQRVVTQRELLDSIAQVLQRNLRSISGDQVGFALLIWRAGQEPLIVDWCSNRPVLETTEAVVKAANDAANQLQAKAEPARIVVPH